MYITVSNYYYLFIILLNEFFLQTVLDLNTDLHMLELSCAIRISLLYVKYLSFT